MGSVSEHPLSSMAVPSASRFGTGRQVARIGSGSDQELTANQPSSSTLGRRHKFFLGVAGMRTLRIFLVALPLTSGTRAEYPHVWLSNATVRVLVYLPDATNGYYRAARFDWAGMIGRVEFGGHSFFGEWKDQPHDPLRSDDVVGPAEEFGMRDPPGYATARAGETFVKIGVGRLRKPVEEHYGFANRYEIVDYGRWRMRRGTDWIEFTHTLAGTYVYGKRVTLKRDGFVVRRSLRNTSRQRLVTDHYVHNFVVFDEQPVGTGHWVELPAAVEPQTLRATVRIEVRTIRYLQAPRPDTGYWAELKPPPGNAATFYYEPGQLRLSFAGDRPVTKVVYYGIGKAVCIEPFIELDLAPDAIHQWSTRYRFTMATGRNGVSPKSPAP